MQLACRYFVQRGAPIHIGAMTVVCESRVVSLRTPVGGFVWAAPSALLLTQRDEVTRHRIIDVTRIMQVALVLGAAAIWALVWGRSHNTNNM